VQVRKLWRQRRVRAVVYAALVAAAVAVAIAAIPAGPHDDGPLPELMGEQSVSHVDPRLTEMATELAGRPVEVRCWSAADWRKRAAEVKSFTPAHIDVHSPWSGYTSRDHKRANFGPNVCRRLAKLAYFRAGASTYDDSWWLAWSLGLFAHETGPKERPADAECHAMQRIVAAGEVFGLTQSEAARLSRLFWTDIYPREGVKFRSGECRPGGKRDLRPDDPAWP
jgi:hypothetical protein